MVCGAGRWLGFGREWEPDGIYDDWTQADFRCGIEGRDHSLTPKYTVCPQVGDKDLLSFNSMIEMSTEDTPVTVEFGNKNNIIKIGERYTVPLKVRNGIRWLRMSDGPKGMTDAHKEALMIDMRAKHQRIQMIGIKSERACLAEEEHDSDGEEVQHEQDEGKNQKGGKCIRMTVGNIAVTINEKKRRTKHRSGDEGKLAKKTPSGTNGQAIMAMLGHCAAKAAARTVKEMRGKLRNEADLDEIRNTKLQYPHNVVSARANARKARQDFSQFHGKGDTIGGLTQVDSKPTMGVRSTRGNIGFSIAIDAKSGYATIRLFRTKQTAGQVITMHEEAARQYGITLRYIRPDNGTEVSSKDCEKLIAAAGATLEVANTATPNHIARAEFRIGRILTMVRALLEQANFPFCMWDVAALAANDILNTIIYNGKEASPKQQWRQGERTIKHRVEIFGERWILKDYHAKGDPVVRDRIAYYVMDDERQPNQKRFLLPPRNDQEAWKIVTHAVRPSQKLDNLTTRRTKVPYEMRDMFETTSREHLTKITTVTESVGQGEQVVKKTNETQTETAAGTDTETQTENRTETKGTQTEVKRVTFSEATQAKGRAKVAEKRNGMRSKDRPLEKTKKTKKRKVVRITIRRSKQVERKNREQEATARQEQARKRGVQTTRMRTRRTGTAGKIVVERRRKRSAGEIDWYAIRKRPETVYRVTEACFRVVGPDSPSRREWMGTKDEPLWIAGEVKEITAQLDCGAWRIVPASQVPKGVRVMKSGWTYLIKRCKKTGKPLRYKARFHVCGYSQVKGVNYDRTFSPVAKANSVRMVMAIAAGRKWKLRMMDVSTAFLQSDLVYDNLYAEMPEGYEHVGTNGERYVIHCSRPIYGARQASRRFFMKLKGWLKKHGFRQNIIDPCVYERDGIIMAVHVDDMTCAVSSQKKWEKFVAEFTDKKNGGFTARDEKQPTQVLGGAVTYGQDGTITWSHELSVEKLVTRVEELIGRTLKRRYAPGEKGVYLYEKIGPETEEENEWTETFPIREVNGVLCYLASTTRPDIAFEASQVAAFNDKPRKGQAVKHMIRIVEYLNRTKEDGVMYGRDLKMNTPMCLGDASHAWHPTKGTGTSGHVVFLYGGPVAWKSKTIKLIVLSSRDSEAIAMERATNAALWAREWMLSFELMGEKPTMIYSDSKAVVDGLGNGTFASPRRPVVQAGRMMAQEIEVARIEMWHISGTANTSDILTKSEGGPRHRELAAQLLGKKPIDMRTAGVLGKATWKDYI